MINLKFSWLGSPIIECGNSAVRMETRKATALLAYLGLSPEPLPRENLAALFWSEFDQSRAHANLRRALSSINQVLGPGILVSNRETIGINESLVWQDVSEFCSLLATVKAHNHKEITTCPECILSLEKVIKLYRGEFLEGVNLKDCPEFDDWQYIQREGFRSDLAFSLEKLAHAYSELGDWEKAIFTTRQWVNLDRLHEAAHRNLIEVYALAGQRSAAIRQYEECSRWLQDELGQSPEEETIAIFNKVQTGEIGKHVGLTETSTPHNPTVPANRPLIKTKLFKPPLRPDLISRPQLIAKLERGTHCALTLISAPAGYGKTTLLSEWIDTLRKIKTSTPWTVCWLSLDAGDNDPIRFLTYLTAALEYALPEFGAKAQSLLQSAQSLQPTTPLSMLINDLQDFSQSVILVLDDYQIISNATIHDGIIFLLEHMPSNVHLVIATRSDPLLPLARLRGRNQLNEVRANDLRFTPLEAAAFLKTAFNLSLTPEQITVLENRTEGWIAGLQMAAISMQGRTDVAQFIDMFSGSHRFIIDYLTEEALNRQPASTQAFLLRTSILERLSESLCSFILIGKSKEETDQLQSVKDFSFTQGECQNILKELELSNLFIVPLDDDRTWYRYHHLFADLLRTRLAQTTPKLILTLHMRASAWFEKNGWIEESITHSLAAKDWDNASRLFDLHFQTYFENGQMATVLKWIEGFPQDVIFSYPKLCIQIAEVYLHAGMIDQIDPLLNMAEETVSAMKSHVEEIEVAQAMKLTAKDANLIRSKVAILRGLKSVLSGDPSRGLNLTQGALLEIPEMEPEELAELFWVEGWAYRSLGNLDDALDSLTKATEFAPESRATFHNIWTDLAIVTGLVGKLPKAVGIFTNLLENAADRGVQYLGSLSRDEAFLSLALLEQNQLDLSFIHANRAIAANQWWPSHNTTATAYASLAQILLTRDDLDGSLHAIQKADQERKNRLMTPFVHSIVDVTWVCIWLIQSKWDLLDQWSNEQISILNATLDESKSIDEYLEMRFIMLVRVWMEKTRIDKSPERNEDCLHLLDRLENSSQTAGRNNSLVEILFLREVIRFSQGNKIEAVDGLEKCFSIAEPGGYMRIFLNTGEPADTLLLAYLQKSNAIHKSYALKILKAFGGLSGAGKPQATLPEPITSREKEILWLLAEGCSNRQIAEKLVLAEGTVKFHVHNLLVKLQVDSRTQVIKRAKDLDLI